MKTILQLALLLFFVQNALAQTSADSAYIRKMIQTARDFGRSNIDSCILMTDSFRQFYEEKDFDREAALYGEVLFNWSRLVGIFDATRISEAIEAAKRCLEIYEKHFGHESLKVADACNNLGARLSYSGDTEGGITQFERALTIQRNQQKPGGERALVQAMQNVAAAYSEQGRLLDAKELYEEALQVSLDKLGRNNDMTASLLFNFGITRSRMEDYLTALECYSDAFDYFEKTAPTNGILANISNGMGEAYRNLGDFSLADLYYQKALSKSRQALVKARTERNIGFTASLSGDYARAKAYFALAKKDFAGFPPDHPLYFELQLDEAVNETENGDPAKAIRLFQALADSIARYPENGQDFQIGLDNYLPRALLKNGQTDAAAACLRQFIAKYAAGEETALQGYWHADNYRLLSLCLRGREAVELADSAISWSGYRSGEGLAVGKHFLNVPGHFAARLRGLVQVWEDEPTAANLAAIEPACQQTLRALRHCRSHGRLDESRQLVSEKNAEVLALLTANLHTVFKKNGDGKWLDLAFRGVEESKNISLAHAVQSATTRHLAGVPDSMQLTRERLLTDAAAVEKQIWEKTSAGQTPAPTLAARRIALLESLSETEKRLAEFPAWRRCQTGLTPLSVAEVQQRLLPTDDDVLLEFVVGQSELFCFVVRRDAVFFEKIKFDAALPAQCDSLNRCLRNFERLLPGTSDYLKNTQNYIRLARLVYEKTVAPLRKHLKTNVLVVPDGFVSSIPFDALLDAEPANRERFSQFPYLLRNFDFHKTWSATLQADLSEKPHPATPRTLKTLAYAPFSTADTSVYRGLREVVGRGTGEDFRLDSLLFSGSEVHGIGLILPTQTRTDSAATLPRFLEEAPSFDILHLATHAKSDERTGDFGWLAFYPQAGQPSLLTVREIYNLRLPAELVILSACETGAGRLRRGEGVLSLARAFVWAGARSVVASQWRTTDVASERLMLLFYKNLAAGQARHTALRQAKLTMLTPPTEAEMERYKKLGVNAVQFFNPFSWAGFWLAGEAGKI